MPRIPSDDDDGRFEAAEPPELSEATKHALARQQKLDDGNFIIERTLAFKNEMAAEFERSKRDGDSADPMFEPNIMKFGFEMRSSLLSDIPRGPRGRLISPDAIEKTRSNMESTMERFSTAALHRLNLERHSRAFANIEAAGEEFAKAAGRDARGLQGLLITVDNLMDRYEGVFADGEIAGQRARLRTGTVIAAINGLIEQGKTGFARELIQKGAFDADLGDQPAKLLLGRIAKTEKDNAFKAADETVRARRLAVAEIGLRARKGQLFPAELDAALAEGTIGPEEHTGFLAEIERFEEDRDKRIEDMARVSDLLARGEKPDADDPADRAAIDAKFEGLTAAIAERPPEERAFIETRFVRRTGMLPATLRDRLFAGMYSEDPAAQVTAAGRLVAFDNSDPTLTAEIPDDTLTRARMITAYAYPGLPPARIVLLAAEKMAQQEAEKAEDEPPESDVPDVPEKSADEGNSGKLPIIQETSQKPAADPFQLTPEQKDQARQTIATVDNQTADKLTREEKIVALKYLRRKPNLTSKERKAAITIFRTIEIDPVFEAQEKPKRERVLNQLPKDEIIKNAVKKWRLLTPKEKLAALDRAVAIHASIFGTEKPKVKLEKLGLPEGQYDQRTNTITIDLSKEEGKFPALEAFGKIIHEAAHAQQHQLAKDFSAGKIKPGDSRWFQAQTFSLNEGQLYIRPTKPDFTLQEGEDYLNQPVEKHAKVLADQVGVKLFELRN